MSEIIDPRQEAKGKKKEHHSQQLEESPPWACQDLPTLEELHKETGQNSKLGSCRANLQKKSITDNVRLMPPAWPLQPAPGISYFLLNSCSVVLGKETLQLHPCNGVAGVKGLVGFRIKGEARTD